MELKKGISKSSFFAKNTILHGRMLIAIGISKILPKTSIFIPEDLQTQLAQIRTNLLMNKFFLSKKEKKITNKPIDNVEITPLK